MLICGNNFAEELTMRGSGSRRECSAIVAKTVNIVHITPINTAGKLSVGFLFHKQGVREYQSVRKIVIY